MYNIRKYVTILYRSVGKKSQRPIYGRSPFSPLGIHCGRQVSDRDGDIIVLNTRMCFYGLSCLCMLQIARECNSKKPGRKLVRFEHRLASELAATLPAVITHSEPRFVR